MDRLKRVQQLRCDGPLPPTLSKSFTLSKQFLPLVGSRKSISAAGLFLDKTSQLFR
ncbi:Hypothetical protein FKW44_001471 [Caligus rogercresseyi]|uniref:Uncharacterized protein n=1 Tax=Caligus rogercresseyi TaxID=217165 RepID=A0A7T8KIS5_CALRO|nr:Hypothetical protein FKW44_001471 [Caligus rogercresseyi]